jgi:hypothetical protein
VTPEDARGLLLRQHRRLLELLAAAKSAAELRCAGQPQGFAATIAALRDAFLEHNDSERALLQPLLLAGDAYSPQRVQRMLEEHAGEHAALYLMFSGDELTIARMMADVAEELEAHMAAEERTFLSPAVLRSPQPLTGGRPR